MSINRHKKGTGTTILFIMPITGTGKIYVNKTLKPSVNKKAVVNDKVASTF